MSIRLDWVYSDWNTYTVVLKYLVQLIYTICLSIYQTCTGRKAKYVTGSVTDKDIIIISVKVKKVCMKMLSPCTMNIVFNICIPYS